MRAAFHHRKHHQPRCGSLNSYHPRPHRAEHLAQADGGNRLRIRFYGSQFAQRGAGPHCRLALRRRHLHQPHPRPLGLPQDDGQLPQCQEKILRRPATKCLRPHQLGRQKRSLYVTKHHGPQAELCPETRCRLQRRRHGKPLRRHDAQGEWHRSVHPACRRLQCQQPVSHLRSRNSIGIQQG